ncbi:DNA polymerase III subunit epsilon [Taylorella equigenitalis]|uniref:DNA polymerase III subunit epsilon n=2 Tax=Taylorella equigenitalis TaxID=29575 RepID=A0A654KHC1_TAYEM|nr:DNA polymerase III subunit epsilon [Taylorella equigenitalis]ADU91847.1 DNA polymerase III epsilon subunit [Taylorella equigenitalis MCE9]AFN35412.1 DNA polymerase III, epsilon subunit [Taylorella equigenitalis ATCC 35865]ASY30070.1 DNA polymerase III subunit epsilon [Taylorella equigenitalis]ASY37375.1 DNA polymerase III subunit epsilon [Taylorella equigenitalis]ASY38842.1 DNA polymerase III subunit epsilon [Taylorella equigenitalis]
MRQICLDTETTGLSWKDGHRVIELGCCEIIDGLLTGNNLQIYFNPEREVDEEALKVHGISNEFLSDKPLFSDKADKIIEYLKDAQLVIHNAEFDMGFLNYELSLCGKPKLETFIHNPVIDTRELARENGFSSAVITLNKLYKDLVDESYKQNTDRELHGALLDAVMLAKVFIKLNSGQNEIFLETSARSEASDDLGFSSQNIDLSKLNLKLIKASEEEIAAHNDYIATLSKEIKKEINW